MGRLIAAMARRLAETRGPDIPLHLVGIRTRGVPLAHRLARELTGLLDTQVAVGAVDITLYRDDLGEASRWPVLRGTEIPLEQGLELEDVAWRRAVASEDRREGIAAFNEKRDPRWKGR